MNVLTDMVWAGGRRYQVLKSSMNQMMILLNRKKNISFFYKSIQTQSFDLISDVNMIFFPQN